MTPDRIAELIRRQNAAADFLRKYQKKEGGVGFFEPDTEPLVIDSMQVAGNPVVVKGESGDRIVTRKARILTLQTGKTVVISGGTGSQIQLSDAIKIFPREKAQKLKKALKVKITPNSVK